MATITTDQVWKEVEENVFAVLGMVTARDEARTVGVVYIVRDRKFYIGTDRDAWKTRHVAQNPHVSLTIAIPKRVPLMPWIKVPAATVTFAGTASVREMDEVSPDIVEALYRGLEKDPEKKAGSVVLEVVPEGDFVTYGVGVSLMTMRDTDAARGRVPVQ